MSDLLISQAFTGQIPQKYTYDQIRTLTDDQLAHFDQVLNVPNLDREQLIRILTHLDAIVPEEQIFAVWDDIELSLYSFDPSSTPKADLILSKYDQFLKEDVGPEGEQKAPDLMAAIHILTQYDDPGYHQKFLPKLQELLGQPITKEELDKILIL